MKYIVAVSGGVDSVVLLHTLVQSARHELIVAHFDHGIRDDSAEDTVFVGLLAAQYNLPFETKREVLGKHASEELARERRYAFLQMVAQKHNARIATAHHADDVVETIAINTIRGTGWRGVAALGNESIDRPLLGMRKQELITHANKHNLSWREDSTNASDAYLRNRVRVKARELSEDAVWQLAALRAQQLALRRAIDADVQHHLGAMNGEYDRYFFTNIPENVASEYVRAITRRKLTRPQRERALIAIKTLDAGKTFEAGSGVTIAFTRRTFTVKVVQ